MMKQDAIITARIDHDAMNGIRQIAAEDGRTVSFVLRQAIMEGLDRWEKEGTSHEHPQAHLILSLRSLSRDELASVLQALGIWVMPPER